MYVAATFAASLVLSETVVSLPPITNPNARLTIVESALDGVQRKRREHAQSCWDAFPKLSSMTFVGQIIIGGNILLAPDDTVWLEGYAMSDYSI